MAELFDLRPKTLDLIVSAGDTFSARVVFSDPDAYDLEAITWDAQIRESTVSEGDPLGEFTVEPTDTGVMLSLAADTTRTLWELRTDADQDFYRPADIEGESVAEFDPESYGRQVLPGDSQPWYPMLGLPKTLGENAWVGFWDLQMTDGEAVTTLCRGTLSVVADVTR